MNDYLISKEEVLNLIDTAFENGAFDGRYAYENLIDAVQNLIHPLETDSISRKATVIALANNRCGNDEWDLAVTHDVETVKKLPSVEPEPCEDKGEISDGYHTFNQLYHQRAILFATIVNQNKDKSWKSYKHSDGKYCFDSNGEWFIVGIDTPEGSYTYHYSKEYWDYFECKELDCGKEWDGHTEDDVIRLLSLTSVEPERKPGHWEWDQRTGEYVCSECGCNPIYERTTPDADEIDKYKYCRWCGAPMEVDG